MVPSSRILPLNDAGPRPAGDFVLYWMIASRRHTSSFALQRARDLARESGRPLVVLEALRIDHPHASPRLHAFVLEGMADNGRAFAERNTLYHPYVERAVGEGRGLVEALAARAVAVVTDDFPTHFLPRMTRSLASRVGCRVEAVDGNGLLPMRATDRVFTTAHSFRRHLQKTLLDRAPALPEPDPLMGADVPRLATLPTEVTTRWPAAELGWLDDARRSVTRLALPARVPVAALRGGSRAARERLDAFVAKRLVRYLERNHPDADAQSGLSPYLHFGHVGAHDVLRALWEREQWSPERMASRATGAREGFWGMSAASEAFVDQLVTWRELGFNMAALRADHASYEALPSWALATLERHASDPREHVYDLDALEEGKTHDPLWNAAARELRETGGLHNYLRMLWGKKILEWSASPRDAAQIMITLNDRYALDGRDPNSYAGIFWTLGRYDRPWGPERPVFGTVRYMSSASTRKKLRLSAYLARFGDAAQSRLPY